MKIQAICTGSPSILAGRKTKTGIFKHALGGALIVDQAGIAGDAVMNRKYHGGPDQALLIEGLLTRDWWAAELGETLAPGTFGENLVIEGLDNRDAAIGDRFRIGSLLVEVTAPRMPCSVLAARMGDPRFVRRFFEAGRPGLYVRVLQPGTIAAGDPVAFEPYQGRRMSLPEVIQAMSGKPDPAFVTGLLETPVAARVRAHFSG